MSTERDAMPQPEPPPGPSQATRRDFLTGAARKVAYATPFVVVLGSNSEAFANSKDNIPWSQCGSQGDPCDTGACCPGYMCVSVNGMEMCEPDLM